MGQCKFNKAWQGQCKNEAIEGSDFCKEHTGLKCSSCGEPATRECDETMGLVCGAPLCDNCEHTIQSNGCNNGGELPAGYKAHCRKGEQVFTPWFTRDDEDEKKVVPFTKRDLCLSIVEEFKRNNRELAKDFCEAHVYLSSKLAVAMEYLGMLESDSVKRYAASRGGILFQIIEKEDVKIFTLRDMIELLPE